MAAEGPNDGLVSVESSKWGEYKGTLDNVSHLDLINWTNRLRWYIWELTGGKQRNFNAIAFYLHITGMTSIKVAMSVKLCLLTIFAQICSPRKGSDALPLLHRFRVAEDPPCYGDLCRI